MLIRISRGVAVAVGIFLFVGSFYGGVAYADTPTTVTVGSASAGSGSAVSLPSDQLPDAVSNPGKAFDAAKAAQKISWPLAVLAVIIMLGRGVGQLGKKLSWLAWLNKGAAAVVMAGIVTVSIAAFNALASGGNWYAVLVAVAGAGFALLKPHVEPQPTTT